MNPWNNGWMDIYMEGDMQLCVQTSRHTDVKYTSLRIISVLANLYTDTCAAYIKTYNKYIMHRYTYTYQQTDMNTRIQSAYVHRATVKHTHTY